MNDCQEDTGVSNCINRVRLLGQAVQGVSTGGTGDLFHILQKNKAPWTTAYTHRPNSVSTRAKGKMMVAPTTP